MSANVLSEELVERIVSAHVERFPACTPEEVLLKLGEEVGELFRAVNTGRGSVAEEVADVLGVLLVFVGRFYAELELEEVVSAKHRIVVERWRAGRIDPNERTVEVSIDVDTTLFRGAVEAAVSDLSRFGRPVE